MSRIWETSYGADHELEHFNCEPISDYRSIKQFRNVKSSKKIELLLIMIKKSYTQYTRRREKLDIARDG